jgi:iron complex outermembrane receptor protein
VNPKPMEQITTSNGELNFAGFSNGRSMAVSALFEGRTQAPLGITWRLQGTAKRAGNAHTPDYTLKNTGMRELNYSASLGYQRRRLSIEWFHSYFNTDIGIFSGSHIGNLTDLYQAFAAEKPIDSATFSYQIGLPYQHVTHHLQKVKARLALNGIGELKAMYGLQLNTRKEFDKTLAAKQDDGTYAPSLHFLLQTHSFDVSLEHEPVRRMVGAIGVNGFYQQNNYYGNYFIPNYQKFTGGLYITEKWHWHAFSMEAGMRYDLNTFSIQKWENQVLISPAHQYHGLAATTAFRYQFPFVTLHLNMGTTWRAPFVNELYSYGVHHSAASFEIGDRSLKQERSYNTSVTMDIAIRKKFDAEFTLYHHYINDFINLQPQLPATLTIRGAFPTFRFSQIDAIFQGAEFAGSMQWHKHIRSYVKANLTLARQVQNQQFLVGIPPGRIETDIDIRCFEKRNVTMNWSAGMVYTARQHRVRSDADYVDAPAAYTLLQTDVYLTIKTHSKQLQLNAGVQNLLNTSYRDYMNRNRYFADELGRNVHLRLSIPFSFGKLS